MGKEILLLPHPLELTSLQKSVDDRKNHFPRYMIAGLNRAVLQVSQSRSEPYNFFQKLWVECAGLKMLEYVGCSHPELGVSPAQLLQFCKQSLLSTSRLRPHRLNGFRRVSAGLLEDWFSEQEARTLITCMSVNNGPFMRTPQERLVLRPEPVRHLSPVQKDSVSKPVLIHPVWR